MPETSCRNMVLVLGDQLDHEHPALAEADAARDAVLMIETAGEAALVRSHKHRIAVFLSAMRHYAERLRESGWRVEYFKLEDDVESITRGIERGVERLKPEALWLTEPGEWRLLHGIRTKAGTMGLECRNFEDTHFLCSHETFEAWAKGRKRLTMEYFYREMRKRHGVLMDGDEPIGGRWNFDAENREAFGRDGPGALPGIRRFEPDDITGQVIEAIEKHFPDHPGTLDNFGWPVTRDEAQEALRDFIDHRIICYGQFQDAMWTGQPFLYHALISSSLNLKLLSPRETIAAVEQAWQEDEESAPIAAVEGFVRQVLGWREFIRGVYWREMPGYAELNHFAHDNPLPAFFWDAETDMNCLAQAIGDTLENGYAHHIQRLMVIGNYATLAGLDPGAVCDWYLGIYVDAVEWVELPNTLGMALHGDGGIVGSKPYVASGSYVNRMSNYCRDCRYDVQARTGESACPFNSLYWDFLARHREALSSTPRMRMVLKNLDRWSDDEVSAIQQRAEAHRSALRD
ncbi:MAG: cryptochrome/photolyase family protein [Xanthomonadales bacterium]|nr:cryptochrome/photolyase family protein [Xanthomonadales bacterium]